MLGQLSSNAPWRVFLVTEDQDARLYLSYFFSVIFGCNTRVVSNEEDAEQSLLKQLPQNMVVLDLANASAERCEMIRKIAQVDPKPFVLTLLRVNACEQMAAAFAAGSNEVLRFPISLEELAYRLRSRSGSVGNAFNFESNEIESFDAELDIVRRANLTGIEARVVRILLGHEGEIVTRDELSLAIDKSPWSYGDRKFDVHVANIRKKLKLAYGSDLTVRTVRAAGYQLSIQANEKLF